MKTQLVFAAMFSGALAAQTALAQPFSVGQAHKFAWNENAGWLNFADAGVPSGAQRVQVIGHSRGLSGWVWSENVGWINVGSATGPYANTNSTNWGVNYDEITGTLSGFAWGENIGWINFGGGALASPAKPARVDAVAKRFRGFAWSENVGWINLDDSTQYVGFAPCNPADITGAGGTYDNGAMDVLPDGQLTIEDFLGFLSAFADAAGCPGAGPCNPADLTGAGGTYADGAVDVPPDGDLTIEDFLTFLSAFGDATGCQ